MPGVSRIAALASPPRVDLPRDYNAAYDLLQRLHQKGVLDLLNGLLSAGDTVVDRLVDVVSSKEMVTALRIGLAFSNLLPLIDADALHTVIAEAGKETPSLLALGKHAAYLYCANGIHTSKAALALLGKTGKHATTRNWATLGKLAALLPEEKAKKA